MPKAAKRSKLKQYPPADKFRSGCKVSFYYYANETVAQDASRIAIHNGRLRSEQGYDTGYRSAGELNQCDHTCGEYAGLWQVVIP